MLPKRKAAAGCMRAAPAAAAADFPAAQRQKKSEVEVEDVDLLRQHSTIIGLCLGLYQP
jgi:hypothetical protein